MPTWTFVKRGGAPAGTIYFRVEAGSFLLDDVSNTQLVTTDSQMAGELYGHPYLTLFGVTAPAPSPNQIQGVELVDGVLSKPGPGGTYLPLDITAFGAPFSFTSSVPVTRTDGPTPKLPIPAGSPASQNDTYGNFKAGRNLSVTNWNPSTGQTFVPDFAVLSNTRGRIYAHSQSLAEFNDPADTTYTRFGGGGSYGGGIGTAVTATTSNVVTILNDDSISLSSFAAGQPVYGDGVTSIVPVGTTITNTGAGVITSTIGGSNTIILTLSAPIVASVGSTVFSVATEALLRGVGSGSIVGQVKSQPGVVPFGGDITTAGAKALKQNLSLNLMTAEMPRDKTGHGDYAQGSLLKVGTTKIGRTSTDDVLQVSAAGNLMVGRGALVANDDGALLQVKGYAGADAIHTISGVTGTLGTLAGPLNPAGGAISTLNLSGGATCAQPSGAVLTLSYSIAGELYASQSWTLTSPVTVGDTVLHVTSATPNFAYPTAQPVKGNTIASGTFKLTFWQDAPTDGYPTGIVSANIGSVVSGLWQATAANVTTALAGMDAGAQSLTCSFPFSGSSPTLITITKPTGVIPAVGASVVDTAHGNIPAGATVMSLAGGAPADPTATQFYINRSTTNNSNGTATSISDCSLGLNGSAISVTGGPLPATPIVVEFIGPYYGNHHWDRMFLDNTSLVGGTLGCALTQIGLPSDAGQTLIHVKRGAAATVDHFLFENFDGSTLVRLDSTGILSVPGGLAQTVQQTFNASGTFTAPVPGTYAVLCVGGGGAGGGGGSSQVTTPANQVGGGGGSAGDFCIVFQAFTAGQTAIVSVGTGSSAPGAGGTAGSGASGNAGGNGGNGGTTTVVVGGVTICSADGGSGGKGSAASSTTAVSGAYAGNGGAPNAAAGSNNLGPGSGGQSGAKGGSVLGYSGGGAAGGSPATTTLGGAGGGAGTRAVGGATAGGVAGSGTTGGAGGAAAANTGAPGGGGGGGAAGGAGGNGGNGGSGYAGFWRVGN